MKAKYLTILVPFLFSAISAMALEVGQTAPCVVLNNVYPAAAEVEECIRTRKPGNTFTLLEFFSVTCSDCQKNLPKLAPLSEEIAATTTTRLVSIDRQEADVRKFLADQKDLIRFPVALDLDRDAKKAYGVIMTPTLFILDQNETVLFKHEGGVLSDKDLADIKAIVK